MSFELLQKILEVVIALGIAAFGFGYLYSQFFQGKNNQTKESIDTENSLTTYLKNQIEGFKDIVAAQDKKINEMGKEIAAMRAVSEEKDKTITKYLEILQNRNPEMDAFIKKVTLASDAQAEFRKQAAEKSDIQMNILKEIQTFMESINNHMEKSSKDLKIEATVTQGGK